MTGNVLDYIVSIIACGFMHNKYFDEEETAAFTVILNYNRPKKLIK
jgi:hypothetical protein